MNLTQENIKELLSYCPETGDFTWIEGRRGPVKAGRVAGTINSGGYIRIKINGKKYMAHRLAWLYIHGAWPIGLIDHKNGIRTDNRICNIRQATSSENSFNSSIRSDNTSGVKGVYWNEQKNKWRAECVTNGKYHHLGYFHDLAEANQTVKDFREKNHGKFFNHGVVECDIALR